jgi:hypothetical protein
MGGEKKYVYCIGPGPGDLSLSPLSYSKPHNPTRVIYYKTVLSLQREPSLRVIHLSFAPHAVEGAIKSRCDHVSSPLRW